MRGVQANDDDAKELADELAKLMGASRVIAACGSDAKLSIAAAKGAEAEGINYAEMDGRSFRARLKEVAADTGIDCVVDMVGGALHGHPR